MKRFKYPLFTLIGLWLMLANIQAQTPIAQYSFTGNANDLSSFGNNALINGATPTQDRFGFANSAFAFDGVQSSIRVNNAAQLNSGNTTISFWVKVKALPLQGEMFLFSHGGYQERWKISLPSHGKPVFTTNSTGGIKDMDSDSVPLVAGKWTHVVMVHDSVSGMNKAYINGALKKSIVATGNLKTTTKPLGMGYDPIDVANYFNGSLDEVMLFNTALTDAQIAALYTAQSIAPTIANGLVANYGFAGSGRDSASFANHAVLNNVKETTDRFGFGSKAYSFNGTSSYISASNATQLNSPLTTISFWVKVKALPAQGEAFLLSNGGYQDRWKISLPSHGKVVFTTNETSGISDMDAGDGNALTVGVWKHIVMTHDGAKDKIFIDGVKKAEKAVVGNLNTTTRPFGMGYDPIDKNNFFNGSLDEVQIYNYVLTEAEVSALYTVQATSPAIVSDLVADYKLMGNGKDDSQFGNTATGKATPSVNRFNYGSNAMNFNGTDSLVAENSVALQSNFTTISFWVKVKELPLQGEAFLLSNGGYQERWKISLPSHGKPVFTTNAAGGIKDMDTDSVQLPVGQWRHVVAVHDGLTDKLFINGLLKKSIVQTGALNKTSYPLGIGYNPVDGGGNFKGDLDDIAIYKRALTDVEVLALYGAQSATPTFTTTLVAHYPFDNNGLDITAFANTAVIKNAVPTKDRFNKANKAIAVNNSTITAANSPQQNSVNTTISFWVKVNALPAQGEAFLLSNGGYQQRWKISLPAHGKVVFTTNETSGISDMDAGAGNELPVGTWKHVVMTHDGAKDKIFIDGVKKAEKVVVGNLNNTNKPLGMGYDPIDSTNFFNGSLDEVQLYNVALTEAEVAALYTAQSTAPADTDILAPSAPINLAAVVAFTNVTLSWLPSTDNVGVVAYNVFKNNVLISSVTSTSILLTGLTATTKFTFGVTAVDAAGNESAMSTLQVTTGQEQARDSIPPTIPTSFAAQIGSNSVQLTWVASTDNRAVTGYVILKDGIILDTVPATTFSKFVGGLTALTAYTFNIYALDAAGNKSPQAEITVTTKAELNTGEAGLIASYPFDDNANDATPYLNHGIIGGNPTFITHTGFTGKALKFDGDKDSVIVRNAIQLISDYTSVGFWIRVDSVNTANAESYIIDFGHYDQRWKISLPHHLRIVWSTSSKNAQFANAIVDMDSKDGNELIKGIWWHVVAVHDGLLNLIYVNGVLANSVPAPGKLNSTARVLCFGSNNVEGGQYFNGALDNVKIYNKALTAVEANKLFRTGVTPTDDQASAELLNVVKSVSPNPAHDALTIKHAFTGNEDVLVRVMDIAGREIDAVRFAKNAMPNGQFSLNISGYTEGVYFLNFVQGGKSLGAVKFVKQ